MKPIDISYKKIKLKRKELENQESNQLNEFVEDLIEIEQILKLIEKK